MNFNSTDGHFETQIRVNTSVQAPSVIYVNQEYWYQKNYRMKLSDEKGNILQVGEGNGVEIFNYQDKHISVYISNKNYDN